LLSGICTAAVGLLSSDLFFLLYLFSIVIFPRWLFGIWTNRRECIVIFPTGLVQYVNRHISFIPFILTDNWVIASSSWMDGTACRLQEHRFVNIPPRFHKHHQIAESMVEAFQRFRTAHEGGETSPV